MIGEPYDELRKSTLQEILEYYKNQGCTFTYSLNNIHDIIIGVYYKGTTTKILKDLIIVKKQIDDTRVCIGVRIPKAEESDHEFLKTKTMKMLSEDSDYMQFISNKFLDNCNGYSVNDDRIFVWSRNNIFVGDLDYWNHASSTTYLKKLEFEVP